MGVFSQAGVVLAVRGVRTSDAAGRARGMSLAREEVSKDEMRIVRMAKSYSFAAVLSFLCITWSIVCSTFCMMPMIAVVFFVVVFGV